MFAGFAFGQGYFAGGPMNVASILPAFLSSDQFMYVDPQQRDQSVDPVGRFLFVDPVDREPDV
jgi:hypothetical protein